MSKQEKAFQKVLKEAEETIDELLDSSDVMICSKSGDRLTALSSKIGGILRQDFEPTQEECFVEIPFHRAIDFFLCGKVEVFRLYDDGSEGLCDDQEETETRRMFDHHFKYNGRFGIHKDDAEEALK